MKTREQTIQDQIDYIMDTFEFAKVHKVMKFLGWTWAFSDNGVPEEYELRMQARKMLNSLAEKDSGKQHSYVATGGFHATLDHGTENGTPWVRVDLAFYVTETMNDGVSYTPQATKDNSPHKSHCTRTPLQWCSCGKSRF